MVQGDYPEAPGLKNRNAFISITNLNNQNCMKQNCLFCLGTFLLLSANRSWAIDGEDTRLLWKPAISKDSIAFLFSGDLGVASRDGACPSSSTASVGSDSNPVF